MDLTKYEKIDGCEALGRLANGEHIFSKAGVEYKTNAHGFLFYLDYVENKWETSRIAFNNLVAQGFYIKKPFDVRQAMRDKPDEWVGVYQENDGRLYKVGFDTNRFLAVETELESEASVVYNFPNVRGTYPEDLERCIPIKDASANVNK